MTPATVTPIGMGCGFLKSLLGSFSSMTGKGPTENVFRSLMPVAVRRRIWCSPRAASAAIFRRSFTVLSSAASSFSTSRPG